MPSLFVSSSRRKRYLVLPTGTIEAGKRFLLTQTRTGEFLLPHTPSVSLSIREEMMELEWCRWEAGKRADLHHVVERSHRVGVENVSSLVESVHILPK